MILRDKLVNDMHTFAAESHWNEVLQELVTEILQIQPKNPYEYIQKRVFLKSKLQNSKQGNYLAQVTLLVTSSDPLKTSKKRFLNQVMYLCVEKYQRTKIKKTELLQIIAIILLPLPIKQKDLFFTLVSQAATKQTYSIAQFSNSVYATCVYLHASIQLRVFQTRLQAINQSLDVQKLNRYLQCMKQQSSTLKAHEFVFKNNGDANLIFKQIAMEALDRTKI